MPATMAMMRKMNAHFSMNLSASIDAPSTALA
jgi:hypothetical protein